MNTMDISPVPTSTNYNCLGATTQGSDLPNDKLKCGGIDADVERLYQITETLEKNIADLSSQLDQLRNSHLVTTATLTVLRNRFYKHFEE